MKFVSKQSKTSKNEVAETRCGLDHSLMGEVGKSSVFRFEVSLGNVPESQEGHIEDSGLAYTHAKYLPI